MAIKRAHPLRVVGGGTLAVNGRAGRRVACVLAGDGLGVEVLDMEADADEDGGEDG